jgi:hypothetical protein
MAATQVECAYCGLLFTARGLPKHTALHKKRKAYSHTQDRCCQLVFYNNTLLEAHRRTKYHARRHEVDEGEDGDGDVDGGAGGGVDDGGDDGDGAGDGGDDDNGPAVVTPEQQEPQTPTVIPDYLPFDTAYYCRAQSAFVAPATVSKHAGADSNPTRAMSEWLAEARHNITADRANRLIDMLHDDSLNWALLPHTVGLAHQRAEELRENCMGSGKQTWQPYIRTCVSQISMAGLEKVWHRGAEYNMHYNNCIDLVVSLIMNNPQGADSLKLLPMRINATGEHTFPGEANLRHVKQGHTAVGEMSSAAQFLTECKRLPANAPDNSVVICVGYYSDKSDVSSRASAHPMEIFLGNHSETIQHSDSGAALIGYLPTYSWLKDDTKSLQEGLASARVYQTCIAKTLLDSLLPAAKSGFDLTINGIKRRCYIRITSKLLDWQEVTGDCGVLGGCAICTANHSHIKPRTPPYAAIDNPPCPLRSRMQMREHYVRLSALVQQRGQIGRAETEGKMLGLNPRHLLLFLDAKYDQLFSLNGPYDEYGFDFLHIVCLGLCKDIWTCLLTLWKSGMGWHNGPALHGRIGYEASSSTSADEKQNADEEPEEEPADVWKKECAASRSLKRLIDSRLQKMSTHHESGRRVHIFTTGWFNLRKPDGKHYLALISQLPFVIGDCKTLIPDDERRHRVQALLRNANHYISVVKGCSLFTDADIEVATKAGETVVRKVAAAFPEKYPRGYNTPKAHCISCHTETSIRKHGRVSVTCTAVHESRHKKWSKEPAKETNHKGDVETQMFRAARRRKATVFVTKSSTYARERFSSSKFLHYGMDLLEVFPDGKATLTLNLQRELNIRQDATNDTILSDCRLLESISCFSKDVDGNECRDLVRIGSKIAVKGEHQSIWVCDVILAFQYKKSMPIRYFAFVRYFQKSYQEEDIQRGHVVGHPVVVYENNYACIDLRNAFMGLVHIVPDPINTDKYYVSSNFPASGSHGFDINN